MAHREICVAKRCPEKTVARIRDEGNSRRVDLCLRHAVAVLREHGDNVTVMDTWNGFSREMIEECIQTVREIQGE